MSGDDAVRAQYEACPYPQRDPRDEAKRLVTGSPSHLDEIVHYVFAGRDRRRTAGRSAPSSRAAAPATGRSCWRSSSPTAASPRR